MKKILLTTLISTLAISLLASNYRVLVLLPNRYGANYLLNRSNFEKYGWEVTVAGVNRYLNPCSDYAGPLGCGTVIADTLINEIESVSSWDCVAVMSGSFWYNYPNSNPCEDLLGSSAALNLVSQAADEGLIVIGFCTGVRVLAAADVLDGIQVTGNPNYVSEYIEAGATWVGQKRPPVIQGNIITSTAGDFYNIHNCAAIIRAEVLLTKTEEGKRNKRERLASRNIGQSKGQASQGAWAVAPSADGGCVTAGFTYENSNESDIYIAKFNDDGEEMASKTIEIPGWQFATGISRTSPSGYIIVGYTEDSYGSFDAILIKIDDDLNVLWNGQYGGNGYHMATSVCELNNGNIAFTGYTEPSNSYDDNHWVVVTKSTGEIVWSLVDGIPAYSEMYMGISSTSDGNFILVGNHGNFESGSGNRDVVLTRLNKNGGFIWKSTFSSPDLDYEEDDSEWGVAVTETPDGGFILVGHNDTVFEELKDGFVLKVDSEGNELWRKSIGEGTYYDAFNSVIATDNNIYIGGYTTLTTTGEKGYLVQCDTDGNIEKKEIYGDSKTLAFYGMIKQDDYLLAAGQIFDDNKVSNIIVQKIELESTGATTIPNKTKLPELFPNPATDKVSIIWNTNEMVDFRISIFNVQGRLVFKNEGSSEGSNPYPIYRNDLGLSENQRGFFVVRISCNGNSSTHKLLF